MLRAIIYGVGKSFDRQIDFLKERYDIIGCCDKSPKKDIGEYIYININEIKKYKFDVIFVTSSKYFEEIKNELVNVWNIEESKIISEKDSYGNFKNDEIRDEWVKKKLFTIPRGNIILDAGAGEMRYKEYCSHLKYISQDFCEYEPHKNDDGLQMNKWDYSGMDIICDITNIPLDDETVDAVLCTEVFEHLKNPILAVEEFSRIMRKGGTLILTAPTCSLTHMAPYYFYNGFSEYWYKEYLSQYGFEIREIQRNGNYYKYLQQELYRLKSISKKYSKKELSKQQIKTIVNCIDVLTDLSEDDVGESGELLNFGYMIEAIKVSPVNK